MRLAPSIPGKAGSLLSDLTIPYASWMIDVSYLVTGRGFLGGEGLGLWITPSLDLLPKERRVDGLAGNSPGFKGLLIAFLCESGWNSKELLYPRHWDHS